MVLLIILREQIFDRECNNSTETEEDTDIVTKGVRMFGRNGIEKKSYFHEFGKKIWDWSLGPLEWYNYVLLHEGIRTVWPLNQAREPHSAERSESAYLLYYKR